ncbi:MAG: succinate dehydrogenase, hydrophobic membrane anchor protein [Acetobacteraceae bacterium]|nr:succinate dehydrogenase, hydrophobic membrane anchor protein [Acetobacteraceae bacterium]MDW8397722.1 succinate dehydrogenase, hydrophobic membrane anchor protein [Acetobacteraceae bacterium]
MKRLQTPLGRVRGLGSARSGTHHWWMQRVTSIALVPLVVWFAAAAIGLAGAGYEASAAFVADPVNAVLLLLLVGVTLHHLAAGLQVVIEDYVRAEGVRLAAVWGVKAACLVLGLFAAVAILRIAV